MKNMHFLPKINILRPTIFPFSEITSGVTLTNYHLFQDGFSIKQIVNIGQNINNEHDVQILSNSIGIDVEKLVFQQQIHSNIIQIVNNNSHNQINQSDGLITQQSGLALCIKLADCVGVLCYSPIAKTIGAFHAGWRGIKSRIVYNGINLMKEQFNSAPAQILVYISPAAGKNKYEVGADVAQYFPDYIKPTANEKYLLDLHAAIIQQLADAGINIENNLEVAAGCTIENKNYHSFRRDGDKSGRMVAFISIK